MHRILIGLTHSLIFLLLSGCSHVIPEARRDAATRDISYSNTVKSPSSFIGKELLWGGLILENTTTAEGTELSLFHYKLDRWGEPVAVNDDGGRFVVRTEKLLDPAIYEKGLFLTLTGIFEGLERRKVRHYETNQPVLTPTYLHLWKGPFRWGLKPHPNIYVPYYVEDEDYPREHPYDPGPAWGPYWYRPGGTL